MEWELTNEEMRQAWLDIEAWPEDHSEFDRKGFAQFARAQAKKMVEWGEGRCDSPDPDKNPPWHIPSVRFACPRCMQELRRQVGL